MKPASRQALLLGTGAADIHAPDRCSCPNCAAVRQRGGRSRRTFTATLLERECLLDCGPTVPGQLTELAPDARVRLLVVTHPDGDHFDPEAIARVAAATAPDRLTVVGSPAVIAILAETLPAQALELQPITPGQTLTVHGWEMAALPARHRGQAGDSLIYVVSRHGHALLYATDTGPLLGAAWDGLRGRRLEAVIAEATFGLQTSGIPDLPSAHMNFPLLADLRAKLLRSGAISTSTPVVATHLSLHGCPPYEEAEAWMAAHGMHAGYDGMSLTW